MRTSTIALAKSRMLMREPARPAQQRYRGMAVPQPGAERICSPAGLQRRPWLARLRRALEQDLFVLHYQRSSRSPTVASPTTRRSCAWPTSRRAA